LKEAYTYVDGKRHGLVRRWHENGQLTVETTWLDGKIDGLAREWDENGELK
jgi:antitoxin component YwqK of YwqJK toxin-antitoxin module